MKIMFKQIAVLGALALAANVASAKEYPLGAPHIIEGMEVGSVYLQPITMDKVMGLPAAESDIHLEVDIHATKDNKNTFAEGWWIPYLTISYELSKLDGNGKATNTQKGTLMPMIADDGPHYGSNIKLSGPGKYHVKYEILPPSMNKKEMFGRHIDKETGTEPWFKPFTAEWTFPFTGIGKKGGY